MQTNPPDRNKGHYVSKRGTYSVRCTASRRRTWLRAVHTYLSNISTSLECKSVGINGITQEESVKRKEGQEVSLSKNANIWRYNRGDARAKETEKEQ